MEIQDLKPILNLFGIESEGSENSEDTLQVIKTFCLYLLFDNDCLKRENEYLHRLLLEEN